MDKGPWTIGADDDRIDSDDFTHDASLILYGDFRTRDRRPYLQFIADQLNSCAAKDAQIAALGQERDRMREAVEWACGELMSEFWGQVSNKNFVTELRRRATEKNNAR